MKRLVTLFSLFVLTACATVNSDFSLDFSNADGFDGERLERIDTAINAEIAEGNIAGAVALIARDGDVVYHKSFGFADIESGKPMQADSIFRIASMTKAGHDLHHDGSAKNICMKFAIGDTGNARQ